MKYAEDNGKPILVFTETEIKELQQNKGIINCGCCRNKIDTTKEEYFWCNKIKVVMCRDCVLSDNVCKHGKSKTLFPELTTLSNIEHLHPRIKKIIKE